MVVSLSSVMPMPFLQDPQAVGYKQVMSLKERSRKYIVLSVKKNKSKTYGEWKECDVYYPQSHHAPPPGALGHCAPSTSSFGIVACISIIASFDFTPNHCRIPHFHESAISSSCSETGMSWHATGHLFRSSHSMTAGGRGVRSQMRH